MKKTIEELKKELSSLETTRKEETTKTELIDKINIEKQIIKDHKASRSLLRFVRLPKIPILDEAKKRIKEKSKEK